MLFPFALLPLLFLARADAIEFVKIAPGEFAMGCAPDDSPNLPHSVYSPCPPESKPQHRVRITKPFEIGNYEVTQAQWEQVMGSNPSYFRGPDRPVEQVLWSDVEEFLSRLNARHDGYHYRLPTEAEWEYCARAGSPAQFGAYRLDDSAWYGAYNGNTLTDTPGETHPVGRKAPNPWGLYDMLGNVAEWVSDWYSETWYRLSPVADPEGPSEGRYHVARGGSWYSNARYVRVWNRYETVAVLKRRDTGFRCARDTR
jgi:formylglycine-generating enzyme required for sulfatase activity